jgi:ABC-type phosphate transport system substrate-binding protein
MSRRFAMRRSAVRMCLALGVLSASALAWPTPGVGADTPAGTVTGEGGDAMGPVLQKLLHNDSSLLAPDFGAYTNVSLETGISDFIGNAPGSFGADFLVTERPLTAAEAATAKANGRSFAYIPYAEVPVAVMTLVPNDVYTGGSTIDATNMFCQHLPLTIDLLAKIFGYDSVSPLQNWADGRITCSAPGTKATSEPVSFWANEDRTMENSALMSALDSTPQSQTTFEAGLTTGPAHTTALTTDTTPSEFWPYSQPTIPGGDQALLGKMLGLNAKTKAPSNQIFQLAMGAAVPVTDVWTGDPLGVPWNLPTAAIQNANGAFVAPSTAAATAAGSDATLASTADPTTNNLVVFNPNSSDAGAYNNYLMLESYLVVPTNGLDPDKATALAQFIRYALGGRGQADIASLGAGPATPAMVLAGLKVAQQVAAEGVASQPNNQVSSTTTTTTANGAVPVSNIVGSTGGLGGSSGGTLPATGADEIPLGVVGILLVMVGGISRRLVLRRKRFTQ